MMMHGLANPKCMQKFGQKTCRKKCQLEKPWSRWKDNNNKMDLREEAGMA